MSSQDLFASTKPDFRPLAERMRPASLDDIVGQDHLLAKGRPLRESLEQGQLYSMVLWGPPGCGKTTLARTIAHYSDAEMVTLSAVLSGVADIRKTVIHARDRLAVGEKTVLFVDEVHRFNKAQQDSFLPHIEDGTIIFIGATTENPSFELNNALLSRCKVHVLKAVGEAAILQVLQSAISNKKISGPGKQLEQADKGALELIARAADGDVRKALNLLEMAIDITGDGVLDVAGVENVLGDSARRFDKGGDLFYEQISALHKSVRNSNPDAALYWMIRMLDGGCDPRYIARRVCRMASEDIGLADPRALGYCLEAWESYTRLGSPEGELALAQAVIYLACAPKSNAVYKAFKQAASHVRETGSLDVPMDIRNAPTKMMKEMGYGQDYRYDHDAEGGFAAGQTCFPEALGETEYYQPVQQGLEKQIAEKLTRLREMRRQAKAIDCDDE